MCIQDMEAAVSKNFKYQRRGNGKREASNLPWLLVGVAVVAVGQALAVALAM